MEILKIRIVTLYYYRKLEHLALSDVDVQQFDIAFDNHKIIYYFK